MHVALGSPEPHDMEQGTTMVREVAVPGLECGVTLGMLDVEQARQFGKSGFDYCNHNLDTARGYDARSSASASTRRDCTRLTTLVVLPSRYAVPATSP